MSDEVRLHAIRIERLYHQTVGDLTKPRDDLAVFVAGPIRVEVRCAPKGHRVGTVRLTSAGLLWQGDYQDAPPPETLSKERKRRYLEDFPHMTEARRVFRMNRIAWDLVELFPNRADPHRALALLCRCGDRGNIARSELLDAARDAEQVREVVQLVR